jgi:hypothetical protein
MDTTTQASKRSTKNLQPLMWFIFITGIFNIIGLLYDFNPNNNIVLGVVSIVLFFSFYISSGIGIIASWWYKKSQLSGKLLLISVILPLIALYINFKVLFN